MARTVSLIVLGTLIIVLGATFYQIVVPFLLPLFLAAIVAMLCRPVFHYFRHRTGGRTRLAAALTTLSVMAVFLVPVTIGTVLAGLHLFDLADRGLEGPRWNALAARVRHEFQSDRLVERLQPWLLNQPDADLPPAERQRFLNEQRERLAEQIRGNLRSVSANVAQKTFGVAVSSLGIIGSLVALLLALFVFLLALYYFLADGPAMLDAVRELIPVQQSHQAQILGNFERAVRAVVLATFAAAMAQGLATAIGLWLAGFDHFLVHVLLSTLAALVPLAGTWPVWGPYAIWLAWQGKWGAAIFLFVYGAVFVGILDNVIRTYVLNTDAKLHPLLAFVSVLGGLQVFGLWGIFIGPTVATCLHVLVQIFNSELKEFSGERRGLAEGGAALGATLAVVAAPAGVSAAGTAAPGSLAGPPGEAPRSGGSATI